MVLYNLHRSHLLALPGEEAQGLAQRLNRAGLIHFEVFKPCTVFLCITNPYPNPFLLHLYVNGLSNFLWLISAEAPIAM